MTNIEALKELISSGTVLQTTTSKTTGQLYNKFVYSVEIPFSIVKNFAVFFKVYVYYSSRLDGYYNIAIGSLTDNIYSADKYLWSRSGGSTYPNDIGRGLATGILVGNRINDTDFLISSSSNCAIQSTDYTANNMFNPSFISTVTIDDPNTKYLSFIRDSGYSSQATFTVSASAMYA